MEAVRSADRAATVIAVTNEAGRRSDIPNWMVPAPQFELFLIQKLAARELEELRLRRSPNPRKEGECSTHRQ